MRRDQLMLLLLAQLIFSAVGNPQRRSKNDAEELAAVEVASAERSLLVDGSALLASTSHKRHVTRPRPRLTPTVTPGLALENQELPVLKVIRRRKVVQPSRRKVALVEGDEVEKSVDSATERSTGTFLRPRVLALLDDSAVSKRIAFEEEVVEAGDENAFPDFGKKIEPEEVTVNRPLVRVNDRPVNSASVNVKSPSALRDSLLSARGPVVNGSDFISEIRKLNARRENSELRRGGTRSDEADTVFRDSEEGLTDRQKVLVRRKTLRVVTPRPGGGTKVTTEEKATPKSEAVELAKKSEATLSTATTPKSSLNLETKGKDNGRQPVTIKPVSALFPTPSSTVSPPKITETNAEPDPGVSTVSKQDASLENSLGPVKSVLSLFPTTTKIPVTSPTPSLSPSVKTTTTVATTTTTTATSLSTSEAVGNTQPAEKLPPRIVRPSVFVPSPANDAAIVGDRNDSSTIATNSQVSAKTFKPPETSDPKAENETLAVAVESEEQEQSAILLTPVTRRRLALSRNERWRNRFSRQRASENSTAKIAEEISPADREKKEVSKVLGLLGRIRNRSRRPRPRPLTAREREAENSTDASTIVSKNPQTLTSIITTTKKPQTSPTFTRSTTTRRTTTPISVTSTPRPRTRTSSKVNTTTASTVRTTTVQPIQIDKTDKSTDVQQQRNINKLESPTSEQRESELNSSGERLANADGTAAIPRLQRRPDALRRTPPSVRGGDLSRRLQQRRNLFSFRGERPPLPLLLSTVREALPALVSKNPNGSNFTLNVTFPPSTPRALLEAEKLIPPSDDDEVKGKVLGTSLSTSVSITVSPLEFRLRKRVKIPSNTDASGPPSSLNGDNGPVSNIEASQVSSRENANSALLPEISKQANRQLAFEHRTTPQGNSRGDIRSNIRQTELKRPGPEINRQATHPPRIETVLPNPSIVEVDGEDEPTRTGVVIELKPKLPAPFVAITSRDRYQFRNLPPIRPAPTDWASIQRENEPSSSHEEDTEKETSLSISAKNLDSSNSRSPESAAMDHTYLEDFLPITKGTPPSGSSEERSSEERGLVDDSINGDASGDMSRNHPGIVGTELGVEHPTDATLHRILSDQNLPSKKDASTQTSSTIPSKSPQARTKFPASQRGSTMEEVPSVPFPSIDEIAVFSAERDSIQEEDEEEGTDGPIYLVSLLFVLPVVAVALWYLKKNYPDIQQLMPERLKSIMAHEPSDNGHDDFYTAEIDEVDKKVSTSCHPPISDTLARRRRWEHPRETLRLQSILGEGHFGQVWRAEVDNIGGHQGTLLVAVKNVKEHAGPKERQDLLRELRIMQDLGSHPNVVTLLGCCTEEEPNLVIMEYMVFGKLLTYLRENRGRHNYFNFSHDSAVLTSPDLTLFAYQVATGMEFIAAKGIIHRDLAARNILVDHTKTCKVSDFGMSRSLKEISVEVFEQRHRGALPIRWMSPESLYHNTFNQKTDSWSFGILLWEIITLGSTPYPGLSAREVMRTVREGYRLERPDHCQPQLYQLASSCWTSEPDWRPTFTELRRELEVLLEDQNQGYVDLDKFQEEIYSTLNKSSDEKV